MFKYKIYTLVLSIFLLSFAAVSKEKPHIGDLKETDIERIGILASVNGEPVTLLDVLKICGHEEARLPYMYQGRKLDEEIARLRMDALDEVINNKLVYGDFKKMKFKLPIGYVNMYLDKIAESYNVNDQKALREMLEARGQNWEHFKNEAYQNAAVQALVNSRCYSDVFVTPEEVYNYYKKHKNDYVTPKQLEIQILKLKRNGMHKKELDSLSDTLAETFKTEDKQTFNDAVLMYSEGPEVQNGGNIGWIEKDKLRDDFAKAIKRAKVGDIVGPIKAKEAYYFIRIAGQKSKIVKNFKNAKDGIKEKLIAEKKKQEYINFINSLKEQANIKIFVDRQNDRLFDYYGGRQFAVFRLNTPKDFDKYSPGLQKLSWKNEPHSTLILRPVHRSFNKVGRGLTGTGEFNYQKFEI